MDVIKKVNKAIININKNQIVDPVCVCVCVCVCVLTTGVQIEIVRYFQG